MALGLGSNVGDRLGRLRFGRRGIEEVIRDVTYSSVYETAPEGVLDQPLFLNACCVGLTTHRPAELLRELKRIERDAGRRPGGVRHGPRALDLDILLYGQEVVAGPELHIPHPRLAQRAFALVPLAEIAAAWVDPVSGMTIAQLADRIDRSGVSLAGDWHAGEAAPPSPADPPAQAGRGGGDSLPERQGRER